MMSAIPFLDLKAQYISIKPGIDQAIQQVINDCSFVGGKHLKEFESKFSDFCGAKCCIGVANGTDALFIALKTLGIGMGDEVIAPANSFIATSEAVTMTGAHVVFADNDPNTYNIDVNLIESRISSRTKAIIPVHLYGQPANLESIRAICTKYNLKLVQDCAQAHGATFDGKPLAAFGDILCFSFYPGKNLGAYGDAGALVTNDEALAKKAFMFANHGRISKYDHEFEGMNSRMDGLQAAVLSVKLSRIQEWNRRRLEHALLYNELLKEVDEIITPEIRPNVVHVFHLYVIRTRKRNELKKFLWEQGIETGIHYPTALPFLKAYELLGHKPEDFPVAHQYQNEILSLPLYPEMTDEMIQHVVASIQSFFV
jgi:dTDP-4-amino-4,6-dideoxygalactose transaminase